MSDAPQPGTFQVTMGNNVGGKVVFGSHNTVGDMVQTGGGTQAVAGAALTPEERAALFVRFRDEELVPLRAAVAARAPAALRGDALAQLDALEAAAQAPAAHPSAVAAVRGWFAKHLPEMVATLAGSLANPAFHHLMDVVKGM